jgi:hypothetical protein
MHHFIRTTGLMITLILLLALTAGPAQAHQGGPGPGQPATDGESEAVEDGTLVCLTLVSGTALLAGSVWIRKLRRLTS